MHKAKIISKIWIIKSILQLVLGVIVAIMILEMSSWTIYQIISFFLLLDCLIVFITSPVNQMYWSVHLCRNQELYESLKIYYRKTFRYRFYIKLKKSTVSPIVLLDAEIFLQTKTLKEIEAFLKAFRNDYGEVPEWYSLWLRYLWRKKDIEEIRAFYEMLQNKQYNIDVVYKRSSWKEVLAINDMIAEVFGIAAMNGNEKMAVRRYLCKGGNSLREYYWRGVLFYCEKESKKAISCLRYFVSHGAGWEDENEAKELLVKLGDYREIDNAGRRSINQEDYRLVISLLLIIIL